MAGVEYNLANLICGRVVPGKACNELGKQMADNLIRVAGTQIFEDESRSFIELVVNSIDATRKKLGINRTVGKFGFGFFSILHWIIKYPNNKLSIRSTYMDAGKFKSYRATLQYDNGVVVSLEHLPDGISSGTTVSIDLEEGQDILKDIYQHIYDAMFDIRDIPIYMKELKNGNVHLVNGHADTINTPVIIFIGENEKYISIQDEGTGISEELLFNTLLVPSISTKGVETAGAGLYENHTRIVKDREPSFVITVNDITVQKILPKTSDPKYEYILSMPPDTPVPLARDDIILRNTGLTNIFRTNILALINLVIDEIGDLTSLWDGLNKYIENTKSEVNKGAVREIMRDTKDRQDILFVPGNDKVYSVLGKVLKTKFVVLPGSNIIRTENFILTNFQHYITPNIYWGKQVIIINNLGINIASGGMATLIFLDEGYILANENWMTDLSVAYDKDRLYPYTVPNLLANREDILKNAMDRNNLTSYYDESRLIYLAMLGSLANFENVHIPATLSTVIRDIKIASLELSKENMLIYLRSIYFLFNMANPNVVYGTSQPFYTVGVNILKREGKASQVPIDQKRNLEIKLWLNDIAMKYGNVYPVPDSLNRTVADISRSKLCDQYNCSVEEELILRIINNDQYFSYIIREIRSRYSPELIHRIFLDYILNSSDSIRKLLISPLSEAIEIYKNFNKAGEDDKVLNVVIPKLTVADITAYKFTGKQLFNSIFAENTRDWVRASKQPTETQFQIFEIAVNEGTTRDYIPAVLSELTQNSTDAMKKSGITDYINVGYNNTENFLYFQDYVGIDRADIIYLLIPFLSSKDTQGITTGEMGTGFFNIYRQPYCKYINIQTIKNNIEYTIKCDPVIFNGRVVDIHYTINVMRTTKRNGTLVTVYFRDINIDTFIDISLFVNTFLVCIDYPVIFNNERLEINSKVIYDDKYVTIKHDKTLVSQLLTNGVPFNSLQNIPHIASDVQKSLTPIGLIFNVKKPYYKITQSRTNISTKLYTLNNYITLAIFYLLGQNFYPEFMRQKLLSFMDSPVPYVDVMLSVVKDPDDIGIITSSEIIINDVHYSSLRKTINLIINALKPFRPTWGNILNNVPTSLHPISMDLIMRWFSNKTIPVDRLIQGAQPIYKALNEISILQRFINIYWSLGKKLENQGIIRGAKFNKLPPPTIQVQPLRGAAGLYVSGDHKITLDKIENTLGTELRKVSMIKNVGQQVMMLRENTILAKYFSISRPLNTLLHEITHSFINKSETEGAHDKIMLTIRGVSKAYPFDDAGAEITRILAENGLYSEFINLL